MTSSKKIELERDFAAGVYQSLSTGDTVSHVGIFEPALWTVAPLTILSGPSLPPPPVLCELVYSIHYTRIQVCKGGMGSDEGRGLRQINNCRKVPLQVSFLDDDI